MEPEQQTCSTPAPVTVYFDLAALPADTWLSPVVLTDYSWVHAQYVFDSLVRDA